jgi:type I restriction enzyme S subunit
MNKDWIIDNLSNCFKLKSGNNLTAKDMIDGDFPVFGGNGIAGYHNDFNLSGEHIIIGRVGALCGNARYISEKIWLTDNAFKVTEFKYEFDLKFLNYLLNFKDLRSFARQAAQPVISNSSLQNISLFFPKSIKEQKQIVEILDKAFESIDQAKVNIEKNIENTKELFQSRLNEIFSQKGDGWEEKTINDVCEKIFAGGDVPKDNLSEVKTDKYNIPIFANGIKDKGLYGFTDIQKVVIPSITVSARGTIGYSEIRTEPFFPIVRLIVLFPDIKVIDLEFLHYIIKGIDFKNTGTSIPQLTVPMIKSYIVKFPLSLIRQKEIVKELDKLNEQTKQLEKHYKQKLKNLEELKKSILQKAFSGELLK